MALTNIEFMVKPDRLYDESEHMLGLMNRMRENMDMVAQLMRATESYWKGEAADTHRHLFFDQREVLNESMTHVELRAKDLAEIAANYLDEEHRSLAEADALPSDAIV